MAPAVEFALRIGFVVCIHRRRRGVDWKARPLTEPGSRGAASWGAELGFEAVGSGIRGRDRNPVPSPALASNSLPAACRFGVSQRFFRGASAGVIPSPLPFFQSSAGIFFGLLTVLLCGRFLPGCPEVHFHPPRKFSAPDDFVWVIGSAVWRPTARRRELGLVGA